jgi:hypothetical protein
MRVVLFSRVARPSVSWSSRLFRRGACGSLTAEWFGGDDLSLAEIRRRLVGRGESQEHGGGRPRELPVPGVALRASVRRVAAAS